MLLPVIILSCVWFVGVAAKAGPVHAPEFECCVTVRGWDFTGLGSSKKVAKATAASNALSYLQNVKHLDDGTGSPVPSNKEALDTGQCALCCAWSSLCVWALCCAWLSACVWVLCYAWLSACVLVLCYAWLSA